MRYKMKINEFIQKYGNNFKQNVSFIKNMTEDEFEKGKDNDSEKGTRILGDKQIVDNIIFNWVWVIITK